MSVDVHTSTDKVDYSSVSAECSERWFAGYVFYHILSLFKTSFSDENPKSSAQTSSTQDSHPPETYATKLPQREVEQHESVEGYDIEIDEADCLPETDSKSQFVAAEDSFGRLRRIRLGTASATRVKEHERITEIRLEEEKKAAALADLRAVASYEDI
jgi:hypothetical protein